MKVPKVKKKYCPHCKSHQKHKVTQAKKKTPGSAHPLARYAKHRSGYGKGKGNLGKYGSKPAISKFKMTGKKQSKKTDLRFECEKCKKIQVQSKGFRAKKIEFQ